VRVVIGRRALAGTRTEASALGYLAPWKGKLAETVWSISACHVII
jgi:hypothetical protein